MRRSVWILGLAGAMVAGATVTKGSVPSVAASAQQTSANAQQAAAAEVKIDNFSFGPATITVAVGTTVTWINRDDIPHTVVSDDKVFKSKALDTDDKFSFTFTKAGTYGYFCSLHPKMTGKVIVQ
jgi:plastocyanin